MTPARRLLLALTTVLCLTAFVGSAQAAIVTVGSPLTAMFQAAPLGAGSNVTILNVALPEAGTHVTSPVNGAVVSWTLLGEEGGPISLRVLRPEGGTSYRGVGTSAPVTAAVFGGRQTFSTDLPIQAGDTVGIDVREGEEIAATPMIVGAASAFWLPPLGEFSAPWTVAEPGAEFAYDAEVQPTPTITNLGVTSGPTSGGTAVTIFGADFEGATAVKFGSASASSFAVNSEEAITATAPAGSTGAVPVSVTTVAGTATSAQAFIYLAPPVTPLAPTCTVPKLSGKKLKASKKKSRAADCRIGKVTKRKGVTAKSGKVVNQNPKPGEVLTAGTTIKVTLG